MPNIINIRDIKARPGEKAHGFIEVGETASTIVKIPVGVINGSESGPKLAITAGIHCTEYEGIEAVCRIYRNIDPTKLKGSLFICFVINTPGFQYGTHYVNPLDNKNMNRFYPGDPNGTITDQMCYVVFNEIIRQGEYHIDAHGGEPVEDMDQFIIYASGVNTKEVEEKAAEMARYYLPKYIHVNSGRVGNSSSEVGRIGIPSITPEAGAMAAYRDVDIEYHYKGIQNVMKWLGMIEGPPEEPKKDIPVFTTSTYAKVTKGGIFYPLAKLGDHVQKGDIMAKVKNVFGEVIEEITAPVNGVVAVVFPKRVKVTGDNAYQIWNK